MVTATKNAAEARGLKEPFVLLAEPPESVVVLRIGASPAVVWCSATDSDLVASGGSASSEDVDHYETYADVVEYLAEEEEERE